MRRVIRDPRPGSVRTGSTWAGGTASRGGRDHERRRVSQQLSNIPVCRYGVNAAGGGGRSGRADRRRRRRVDVRLMEDGPEEERERRVTESIRPSPPSGRRSKKVKREFDVSRLSKRENFENLLKVLRTEPS